jgi:hypothetical protein
MREGFDENWVEYGQAVVQGRTQPQPYEMRFLREDELDEAYRLHQIVVSGVAHPHMFRADSRDFMAQQIARRGRTVGTFCDGRLAGYAAISFPDGDPDNLGRDLPLPDAELDHLADYDGSAVHPDFRGNRLQKRMTFIRHKYALAHDRYHILGTVSPLNPVSLSNFLGLGCRVKNLKTKYAGMLRFIIHLDLREGGQPALDGASAVDVPLSETARHHALLGEGFHGFRVVPGAAEAHLRYARPQVVAGQLSASA